MNDSDNDDKKPAPKNAPSDHEASEANRHEVSILGGNPSSQTAKTRRAKVPHPEAPVQDGDDRKAPALKVSEERKEPEGNETIINAEVTPFVSTKKPTRASRSRSGSSEPSKAAARPASRQEEEDANIKKRAQAARASRSGVSAARQSPSDHARVAARPTSTTQEEEDANSKKRAMRAARVSKPTAGDSAAVQEGPSEQAKVAALPVLSQEEQDANIKKRALRERAARAPQSTLSAVEQGPPEPSRAAARRPSSQEEEDESAPAVSQVDKDAELKKLARTNRARRTQSEPTAETDNEPGEHVARRRNTTQQFRSSAGQEHAKQRMPYIYPATGKTTAASMSREKEEVAEEHPAMPDSADNADPKAQFRRQPGNSVPALTVGAVSVQGPGLDSNLSYHSTGTSDEDLDKSQFTFDGEGRSETEAFQVTAHLVGDEEETDEVRQLRELVGGAVAAEIVTVDEGLEAEEELRRKRNIYFGGISCVVIAVGAIVAAVVVTQTGGQVLEASSWPTSFPTTAFPTESASEAPSYFPSDAPSGMPIVPTISPTETKSQAPSVFININDILSCIEPPTEASCSDFEDYLPTDFGKSRAQPCTTTLSRLGILYAGGSCSGTDPRTSPLYAFLDCEDFGEGPPSTGGTESYIVVSDHTNTLNYFADFVAVGDIVTFGDRQGRGFGLYQQVSIYNSSETFPENLLQVVRYRTWECSGNAAARQAQYGSIRIASRATSEVSTNLHPIDTSTVDIAFDAVLFNEGTALGPANVTSLSSSSNFAVRESEISNLLVEPGSEIVEPLASISRWRYDSFQDYNITLTAGAVSDTGLDCDASTAFHLVLGLQDGPLPRPPRPDDSYWPTPAFIDSPAPTPVESLLPTTDRACALNVEVVCRVTLVCGLFDVGPDTLS